MRTILLIKIVSEKLKQAQKRETLKQGAMMLLSDACPSRLVLHASHVLGPSCLNTVAHGPPYSLQSVVVQRSSNWPCRYNHNVIQPTILYVIHNTTAIKPMTPKIVCRHINQTDKVCCYTRYTIGSQRESLSLWTIAMIAGQLSYLKWFELRLVQAQASYQHW